MDILTYTADTPCIGITAINYSCPKCGDFQVIHSHSELNKKCAYCGSKTTAKSIAFIGVKQDKKWLKAVLLKNN